MKVRCIANTGEGLSEKSIEAGYSKNDKFNIDIGIEYTVYGMVMWKGSLDYLLSAKSNQPVMCPAELFKVVNTLLPPVWFFTFRRYESDKSKGAYIAIWGYKEMISNSEHHADLLLGKPEALEIFKKRKKQIDEYEHLNQFRIK